MAQQLMGWDTSQLPGGTGLVKTLYLQCVESLMKNRIELETSAHVSAIEQTFDLQIFYFVMKIVKENMDYLVQFRSFELFLSLNPSTSIRSVEASFNIERPISGRLKFFNMIEKYLSENYSEHLLRVMIFYKCVKKILLKQEIKSSILLNIIENCRQFGAVGVMKQIKDPPFIFYHMKNDEDEEMNTFVLVWLTIERIIKEKDENKKIMILAECHEKKDPKYCSFAHEKTIQLMKSME